MWIGLLFGLINVVYWFNETVKQDSFNVLRIFGGLMTLASLALIIFSIISFL